MASSTGSRLRRAKPLRRRSASGRPPSATADSDQNRVHPFRSATFRDRMGTVRLQQCRLLQRDAEPGAERVARGWRRRRMAKHAAGGSQPSVLVTRLRATGLVGGLAALAAGGTLAVVGAG